MLLDSKKQNTHRTLFSCFLTTAAVCLRKCGIDRVSPAASSYSPSQRWRGRSAETEEKLSVTPATVENRQGNRLAETRRRPVNQQDS